MSVKMRLKMKNRSVDTTQVDLGIDMDANILNTKCV